MVISAKKVCIFLAMENIQTISDGGGGTKTSITQKYAPKYALV